MNTPLHDDFFQKAEQHQLSLCHEKLQEAVSRVFHASDDAQAIAEFQPFFASVWHEATHGYGLTDCAAIGKLCNIRLTEDRWSQSPLHRHYVDAMLNGDAHFINIEDGIAAVHQNIVEQHYA